MGFVSGYTGIYRQPYPDAQFYGDTIYVITDDKHRELNMLLLTPGCYRDAYRIASNVSFQIIHIFVPATDALFISDLFRLVNDLRKIKEHVYFHFPEKITTVPTNVMFELSQQLSHNYVSAEIPNLTIEIKPGWDENPASNHYDLYVCDGVTYSIFTSYVTDKKLNAWMVADDYDEIHMPYNTTFYGGLCAREAVKNHPMWAEKFCPNNFRCNEEFLEMQSAHVTIIPKRIVF